MFINLVIFVVGVFLLLFLITQVWLPAIRGTHFFPFFIKTETSEKIKDAEEELQKLVEEAKLAAISEELKNRKVNLKGKK